MWRGRSSGGGCTPLAALAAEKTAVVMAAAALWLRCWRRWRRRQERGVGVGGDPAMVEMEAIGEGGGGEGRLAG